MGTKIIYKNKKCLSPFPAREGIYFISQRAKSISFFVIIFNLESSYYGYLSNINLGVNIDRGGFYVVQLGVRD